MTTESLGTIWVCINCYDAHNGELPSSDECDPIPLNRIGENESVTAGMFAEEHHEECGGLLEECDCEHDPFTWISCEGCGSSWGGERFAMTLWANGLSTTQKNETERVKFNDFMDKCHELGLDKD